MARPFRNTRKSAKLRNVPKSAKINPHWLAIGTKIEMEHTKDKKAARQIAGNHLTEHPSYYRILPAAEGLMSAIENKAPPKTRRRKRTPRKRWSPIDGTAPPYMRQWGQRGGILQHTLLSYVISPHMPAVHTAIGCFVVNTTTSHFFFFDNYYFFRIFADWTPDDRNCQSPSLL